jgi:hypothetical protein
LRMSRPLRSVASLSIFSECHRCSWPAQIDTLDPALQRKMLDECLAGRM